MRVRPAEPGDKAKLQAFACSNGESHANKLEKWIQRKSPGWHHTHPNIHHLYLLVDDDDELLGLYAFESGVAMTATGESLELEPGEEPLNYWFVKVVALRVGLHGQGLGSRLLETCLDHIAELEPGAAAYWHVDENNTASHRMSINVNAEAEDSVGALVHYFVRL